MSDTPTPGQVAYEAWHAIVIPAMFPGYEEDWSQVSAMEQDAWEAAAAAVLAAWLAQPRLEPQEGTP